MASEQLKLDLSSALTKPLVKGRKGYEWLLQSAETYPLGSKFTKLRNHIFWQKLDENRHIVLAFLGVALVLHGSEFKNLFLCTQVVYFFLFERVKNSLTEVHGHITTARDKLKADTAAAAGTEGEEKTDKSKAQKTKEKKERKNEPKPTFAEVTKMEADMTKKALKELDSGKLADAVVEVLGALVSCILIIQGGLAQKVAIAYFVVGFVSAKVMPMLEFPGYEDLEEWTTMLVRFGIWLLVLPLTFLCGPLMLALNAASRGANLAVYHGAYFLEGRQKIEDAAAFAASLKGLMALGALTLFGTLFQLGMWALSIPLPVYFKLVYLPAVLIEGVLGFF
jgi:hypothetical protein